MDLPYELIDSVRVKHNEYKSMDTVIREVLTRVTKEYKEEQQALETWMWENYKRLYPIISIHRVLGDSYEISHPILTCDGKGNCGVREVHGCFLGDISEQTATLPLIFSSVFFERGDLYFWYRTARRSFHADYNFSVSESEISKLK